MHAIVYGSAVFRLRVNEVARDCGMFERAEAPQYHPPIVRAAGNDAEASDRG